MISEMSLSALDLRFAVLYYIQNKNHVKWRCYRCLEGNLFVPERCNICAAVCKCVCVCVCVFVQIDRETIPMYSGRSNRRAKTCRVHVQVTRQSLCTEWRHGRAAAGIAMKCVKAVGCQRICRQLSAVRLCAVQTKLTEINRQCGLSTDELWAGAATCVSPSPVIQTYCKVKLSKDVVLVVVVSCRRARGFVCACKHLMGGGNQTKKREELHAGYKDGN
jgi:hypothetical protein